MGVINNKMVKETLKFYDLIKRKSFKTNDYELNTKKTSKGIMRFAIATTDSGRKTSRIVSKEFYERNK